ncbi:MAG: ABC transporter permease subunit [Vibrio sp.]
MKWRKKPTKANVIVPKQPLCKKWDLDKRVGRKFVIGLPYLWLFVFFLLPFVIVLQISFSMADVAIPPYTELVSWADDQITIVLNTANYLLLGEDELYLAAYLSSLKMAFISTLACLLIGYPMAYAISKAKKETQTILLLLIMMPTWTAILIRVYAWMGILSNNGLLNGFLMHLGIIDSPIHILNTDFAVYIGIVYSYLPFMVLPLYANLSKHDQSLLEAASDLGCRNVSTFWQITVPLSKSGIIAGCMLVFIPVVGEFVIPELLGGPDTLMIGRVLWQEFFNNRDWPVASALAVVMLAILMIPIIFFNRTQAKELQGK